jgi:CSLREA domain-containing protein
MSAVINGKLYVIGGNNNTSPYVATLQVYDPSSGTWSVKSPMPTARNEGVAGLINGIVYVAGGQNSSGVLAVNEAYDPTTDTWTAQAPLPIPRAYAVGGVMDGVLYVASGTDQVGNHTAATEAFTPAPNIITVNTISDSSGSGDGLCSLREAINNANSPGTDTTGSDCAMGTGTDTINFSVSGTITLGSTLPAIANTSPGSLTIDGTGQAITIDGAGAYRVLIVNRGATLNLNHLTIAHGASIGPGGGISNDGILTIDSNTLSGNSASSNSDASAPGEGGGIFNGGDGTLTIIASTLSGNQALNGNAGGAVYSNGSVTITNSTLSGNSSTSYGGAIFTTAGSSLRVSDSTITGNTVPFQWGGINAPSATLTNTILAGNSHEQCGIGIVTNGGYNISDDGTCGFGSSMSVSGQTLEETMSIRCSTRTACRITAGPLRRSRCSRTVQLSMR